MDEFTRVKTFIRVVEAGSFSAAARDVASVSSVARQVKALEDELGVVLLTRSTRSLALTDAGRRFYQRVTAIALDLQNAMAEIQSLQEDVKGTLRVSLRVAAGTTVVVPALPKLIQRYPHLVLDISLSDERVDLIANKIDVAMWLGELPDSELIARRLSPSRRIIYAAPSYLDERGTPACPEDLLRHSCLVFTAPSYRNRWVFSRDGHQQEFEVTGSVRSDNGLILLEAALSGLGIAIGHEWQVRRHLAEGRLVRILPSYSVNPHPSEAELFAIFPASHRQSRKVRIFVDFLVDIFRDPPGNGTGD